MRHEFAKKDDGDDTCHGKKYVECFDRSFWCHIEFIGHKKDNYVTRHSLEDPTVRGKGRDIPIEVSTRRSFDNSSHISVNNLKGSTGTSSVVENDNMDISEISLSRSIPVRTLINAHDSSNDIQSLNGYKRKA